MDDIKLLIKKFFKILTINNSIHPMFFLVGILSYLFGELSNLVCLTFLALLHELGHAVVANRFGYALKKIRLMPFGAELQGHDLFLPTHEFKISLAGPCVNFIICIICVALYWIFPSLYTNINSIFYISLSLGVFNLFPFYPLDGGRIFLALLSKRMERKRALFIVRCFSLTFSFMLIMLFLMSIFFKFNWYFGIMGVALFISNYSPSKDAIYERISSKAYKREKIKNGLLKKQVIINCDATILKALEKVDARMFTEFIVVDESLNELFKICETKLENIAQNIGVNVKLKQLALIVR